MARVLFCNHVSHNQNADNCPVCIDNTIGRLRGQLQNCVNHLERAKRKANNSSYDEVIESANTALYETLNR